MRGQRTRHAAGKGCKMIISRYPQISMTLKRQAAAGTPSDIDKIMKTLNKADLPVTRLVDFDHSQMSYPAGIERIEHYLFQGTQIQCTYAALLFARRSDWKLVNKAFEAGCIDRIQAYSR